VRKWALLRNWLWLLSGFPESYLAPSGEVSSHWRRSFLQTFLRQGILSFGIDLSHECLRRFWSMAAHYHGQMWNSSAIAKSLNCSHMTARAYLGILTDSFVMRQLPPFVTNMKKRILKAPKIYLRDSRLLDSLLQIGTLSGLQSTPRYGASKEGFALEHLCSVLGHEPDETFLWGTHSGAEMDLIV
jgi:uncharacterized protein